MILKLERVQRQTNKENNNKRNNMAFKIKKSILAGTSGHRKALNLAAQQLSISRTMDQSSLPDGRAKSSAFQLTDDDKKNKSKVTETWEDPTTTTTVTPNVKGGEDTAVKTDQKGTRTTTTENKDLTTFKERCAKYKKKNSAAAKADGCVWAEDIVDPKDDVKTEPLSKSDTKTTSTEKKGCECQTYKADGSKGPMVKHECGSPNPNCSKRPTTKTCSCTPKGGEPITYDCGKAKPAACASKGSSTDCPDSKRQSCPGSSWSWKKCRCNKKPKKAKEVKYKKRCYKGKNGSTICPDLSVSGPKGGGQEML